MAAIPPAAISANIAYRPIRVTGRRDEFESPSTLHILHGTGKSATETLAFTAYVPTVSHTVRHVCAATARSGTHGVGSKNPGPPVHLRFQRLRRDSCSSKGWLHILPYSCRGWRRRGTRSLDSLARGCPVRCMRS